MRKKHIASISADYRALKRIYLQIDLLARTGYLARPVTSLRFRCSVSAGCRNGRAGAADLPDDRQRALAWLEAFRVDRRVNSPNNDDPECIQPTVVQSSLGL
jgi:hypothetical protein